MPKTTREIYLDAKWFIDNELSNNPQYKQMMQKQWFSEDEVKEAIDELQKEIIGTKVGAIGLEVLRRKLGLTK